MSENILDKFKDAPSDEKVRDYSKKLKVGIIGTGWPRLMSRPIRSAPTLR